ncbi:hypothetical protein EJB05_55914 [Eragrostis curvula]|uniref:Rad21/Rec8-like protein C-terminal eukaryotic domain-containing protein n=1 Tax=Eragrostis curvula TaxID=38414 RepID=A0A5J9SIJ3_9POAL|nr:hypothetical protein EJB05_55914 [Eragrostis curvula]
MRKQIDGIELRNLVGKRRKLPLTALEMWKVRRMNRSNSVFLVPLLHGMCTNLHATYERNFPCVSSPEPEVSVGNGGCQDAPPGCKPFEHSSGNGDAQPEPLPTSESPGKDDDDTLPELPRFSASEHMSPWITDGDSAFKTPSTDIPASDGNYPLDQQNTRDSGYMASLFPIDEDNCDEPRIPGLISTPGTGSTGLESMSARTRVAAQCFKNHTPSNSSDEQQRKFSLNGLLVGRTRKEAARMFFETMVLKSYDYIDVQQEEPYANIEISVKPSLFAAKL